MDWKNQIRCEGRGRIVVHPRGQTVGISAVILNDQGNDNVGTVYVELDLGSVRLLRNALARAEREADRESGVRP